MLEEGGDRTKRGRRVPRFPSRLFGSFCQRVFQENMEVKRMVKVKVRRGSVTGFFLLFSLREETGVEFIPTTGHGV